MKLTSGENETPKAIGCELGPRELRCWDGSDEGTLAVEHPYAMSTTVPSQWFFMNLVLHSKLPEVGSVARVNTVFWDVSDGPSDLTVVEFEVVHLGQEKFRIEDKDIHARKILLTPVLEQGEVPGDDVPRMVVAMSEENLLLELRIEPMPTPGAFVSLVHYRQYAEFGPGK
jgi:hypothetical protein